MADRKTTPGGDVHNRSAYYHDEGDGTSDEAYAAHLRGWDTGNLRWTRIATNSATGALLVEATLATSDIEIGAVEIKNATTDDRATVVNNADNDTGRMGLVADARTRMWNGAGWDRIKGDTTSGLWANVKATVGLTDTQLRASAVPVSLATLPALTAGTANIGDVDVLTLPSLVAGSAIIGKVGIDATGDVASATSAPAGTERGLIVRSINSGGGFSSQSGTALSASGSTSTATGLGAAGSVTLSMKGNYGFTTTPPTYIFEGSDDTGTTWYPVAMVREDTNIAENTGTLAASQSRSWTYAMGGFDQIRARVTAWGTPGGTITTKWSPGGDYYEPTVLQNPSQRVQYTCAIINDTMTTTDAVRTFLVQTRDFVSTGATTTCAVTAGKKLRLTGWTMAVKAPSTTAVGGMYTLRVNPTGAATVTSVVVAQIACGLIGTQVAHAADSAEASFPDGGIELSGIQQFTVSGIGVASAGYYLTLYGYEY